MKKTILLFTMTLLILMSTLSVQSYTSAVVDSQATVRITNPDSLIFLSTFTNINIVQGEEAPAFTIKNNMNYTLNYRLESPHQDMSFEPAEGAIISGKTETINLVVADDCNPGSYQIPLVLNAAFHGGSAEIKTTLDLLIEEGVLELEITDEKMQAYWNDNAVREGAEYFYRHRKDDESRWSEWIRITDPETKFYKHMDGEYEFKVKMNDIETMPEKVTTDRAAMKEQEKIDQGTDNFKYEKKDNLDPENND